MSGAAPRGAIAYIPRMTAIDDLQRRMRAAAEAGDFETAALLRDAIARLRSGESNLREQAHAARRRG